MDFSASNRALWEFVVQISLISGILLFANMLRQKIRFVRDSMTPSAVLAGFLLFALRHAGIVRMGAEVLEMLVYHAIALGFIAMSLRVTEKKEKGSVEAGLKSGAVIVGSYLIQGILGLCITLGLYFTVKPDMFPAAGLLLPMGYGQGPGQANNVGSTYEALGFKGGRSFGLAVAAAGYICACVVGVVVMNVLAKRGKLRRGGNRREEEPKVSDFQHQNEIPLSDSIDKFSVQVAMVLLVYLATFLVTRGLTALVAAAGPGVAKTVGPLLWGFNFITGSLLAMLGKTLLGRARKVNLVTRQYQNNYLLDRISGLFFDIMIVAGIAAIDWEDLTGLWLPFVLMAVSGGVVTWIFLSLICKKVYPGYYYEGLLSMYGMMTGTIGSGVLLLREIDPNFETPAATNLVMGSGFAIAFGAPMLILIGIAPNSTAMCFLALGLSAVYFAALCLFVCKFRSKKGGVESPDSPDPAGGNG